MSRISNTLNNASDFSCVGDPHYARTEVVSDGKTVIKTWPERYVDTSGTTNIYVPPQEISRTKSITIFAGDPPESIGSDSITVDDLMNKHKAGTGSDDGKVKTDKKDSIMKNVDHPSQVINQEINRPSHYGSKSGKDVIDWCEDFGIMNNAYVFNIFKYLCRAGKKNNNSELQDALKAQIYLDRYIESLKK